MALSAHTSAPSSFSSLIPSLLRCCHSIPNQRKRQVVNEIWNLESRDRRAGGSVSRGNMGAGVRLPSSPRWTAGRGRHSGATGVIGREDSKGQPTSDGH
ncbi:hypothetical protein E2C01_002878 [Portunus trituberculatus]|uniref:Uncharacterized protein n=1 Tax=Portunus trituberculatus TaxID=210409 RepID=A0A5B7CPD1_PORTR|nr:hypothetical protein [Portunus trituberculatus]